MINCSQCGRENEDHHNFCLGCGANLKAQQGEQPARFCPQCGATVPAPHLFCGNCGASLRQDTASERAVREEVERSVGEEKEEGEGEEAEARAELVLINPDGSSGESIALRPGENVFGREHGPEVFREDPFLSPRHVAFQLKGDHLEVRDLSSLNGVYYRIVEPTELRHLDAIRIGRQLLRFEVLDQCESIFRPDGEGTRALGAPRGDAWGRLTRISALRRNSQAFLLSGPEAVIGRERGTILIRDDGFVSGRHARITLSGGRYYIEDLRSSNGTFLRVRAKRVLQSGDLLLIGQQPLRAVLPG